MQVFCLPITEQGDIECSICGQQYALYFERKSEKERLEAVEEVLRTLEQHHEEGAGPSVHPHRAFTVPEWNGLPHMSGAALLGGAPRFAA